jgi:5-methylcytosine-specific restriction endonuclease McrBC regulatory subunit McrC
MLLRQGLANIISDELSPDTLSNQILRATIGTLLRFKTLDESNRAIETSLHFYIVAFVRFLPSRLAVRLQRASTAEHAKQLRPNEQELLLPHAMVVPGMPTWW